MNHKGVMLKERRQTQTVTYCIIMFVYSSEKVEIYEWETLSWLSNVWDGGKSLSTKEHNEGYFMGNEAILYPVVVKDTQIYP